jgi:hypothetical protein
VWLRSWLFLMRARWRLAWAVLAGRIEVKSSVGLLLTSLTVKELGKQEQEITQLRDENVALRMKVEELQRESRAPYR